MQKPNNHYCLKKDIIPQFKLPFNYKFIEKIGEGSYGQVFKIFDIQKSRILIIKKQKVDTTHHTSKNTFFKQHKLLLQLSHFPGFPEVGQFVLQQDYQYFFMQCLGSNLQNLIQEHGKFSLNTVKYIGYEILCRLEVVHMCNYLHRDIKTENILIGARDKCHEIYLVDFGLALQYKFNNQQISQKKYSGLVGTARYASLAAHNHLQQSPKDDLQSLGYVLSYCLRGKLEWQSLVIQDRNEKFSKIKQIKEATSPNQLALDYFSLTKYFQYVKSLKYEDTPNYQYLKSLFSNENRGKYCFEWCNRNCQLQPKFSIEDDMEQEVIVNNVFELPQ